jgi:succinate dehydrogenase / fumarate reductase membrane anchor subunit
MVTAVTSFSRNGLSDWLVQRVSAFVLLAYFGFLAWVLLSGVDYASWSALYQATWMRIFSLLALLSLAGHAWVGMWSVLTDYLTERTIGPVGNVLRIGAQLLCILLLFILVVWGIQILWA